jgi:nucleotide-binding universal stress UspA family protein
LLERELRPHIQALLGEPAVLHLRPNLGRDADPLAREGERAGADLLVVGTNHHGRRAGSTAVATVRAAGCPVLCVPAESAPAVPEEERRRPLRTLLVPVDLSPASAESVALACRMLQGSGGIIELLNVVEPSAEGLSSSRGAELERRLYALVPGWQQHGIMARPSVVESDSVARAILQAAERLAVDAVVLAAHEHAGLLRAITGAVVTQVMRSCSRPVVVVPTAALAAA